MSNSSVKEADVEYFKNQDQNRGNALVPNQNTIFEGVGWKVRLQQKRSYFFLTMAKELVVGNALKRGDDVFYYLVNYEGRKGLLIFLDSKERPKTDLIHLTKNSSLLGNKQLRT